MGGIIMNDEKQEAKKNAVRILVQIARDLNTPRNIRRAAKEAIRQLENDEISLALRAANAIDILQEITDDPQMPTFARTAILEVISLLDIVAKE